MSPTLSQGALQPMNLQFNELNDPFLGGAADLFAQMSKVIHKKS